MNFVLKMMNFGTKNDEFCTNKDEFVLTMMNCLLTMMDFSAAAGGALLAGGGGSFNGSAGSRQIRGKPPSPSIRVVSPLTVGLSPLQTGRARRSRSPLALQQQLGGVPLLFGVQPPPV